MSMDIAQKAVEWSHKWGAGPLQVIWYGGEPLLGYKTIMKELVPKWTAARGAMKLPPVSHSVTTNGTLLTDEVREWMDQVNMGMLLSLDGPKRFHDKSRPYYDKHSSWDDIKPEGILKWRPNTEIAWQLDPKNFDPDSGAEQITPAVVDEMMGLGFKNIAFNINWMDEWNEKSRWNLQWLFKHITILMLERQRAVDAGEPDANTKGLGCNWFGKLQRALTVDSKMTQPCGTGLNMVGVSPEGWLYPSQEMVYTVVMPGRAPGTAEFYRLGDLNKTPVLDLDRLTALAEIRTEQMRPPAPYECKTCVAHSASIGGCHCRYVGDYQNGQDVANRFDVTPGYCQSTIAVHTGMLMGASVARYIRPDGWQGVQFHGSMQQRAGEKKQVVQPAHVHAGANRAPTMEEMTQTINRLMDRMKKLEDTHGAKS
jgi:sulfatase maturation enzyme AslB (radical SAM superfamily)